MHSSVTHQFSWQAIGKPDSEVAKLKWQSSTNRNSAKQTGEVSSECYIREQWSFKIRNSFMVWGEKKKSSTALTFSILELLIISSSITVGAEVCPAAFKQPPSFSENWQTHGCYGQRGQKAHCTSMVLHFRQTFFCLAALKWNFILYKHRQATSQNPLTTSVVSVFPNNRLKHCIVSLTVVKLYMCEGAGVGMSTVKLNTPLASHAGL